MPCANCADTGQVPTKPHTPRYGLNRKQTFGGLTYCACPKGQRLKSQLGKHQRHPAAESLVSQLLGETTDHLVLTRDYLVQQLHGYEVLQSGEDLIARAELNPDTNGAWEVAIHPADQPGVYRVLGDYMSDATTAAVGLDQTMPGERVVQAIKDGEREAHRVADRE